MVLIDGEATGAKLAQWLFWLQFYFDVRTHYHNYHNGCSDRIANFFYTLPPLIIWQPKVRYQHQGVRVIDIPRHDTDELGSPARLAYLIRYVLDCTFLTCIVVCVNERALLVRLIPLLEIYTQIPTTSKTRRTC